MARRSRSSARVSSVARRLQLGLGAPDRLLRPQTFGDLVPEGLVHPLEVGGPVPDLAFQVQVGVPGFFLGRLPLEIGRQHLGQRLDERPLFLQEGPLESGRPLFQVNDFDQALSSIACRERGRPATREFA